MSSGNGRENCEGGRTQPEFQLGLAMAGAISAGAYSAGVFDFLIQALEAWEAARQDPQTGKAIPNHRVAIKVIAGASAGAVTGALGAVALAGGVRPVAAAASQPSTQSVPHVLPALYRAWVTAPDMLPAAGHNGLLGLNDLREPGKVISVLDASVLSAAAAAAVAVAPTGRKLPYVSAQLDIYMTITNLRGVPYRMVMTGGGYGMRSHGDRAHYVLTGLGQWIAPGRDFAARDSSEVIDVATLSRNQPTSNWHGYVNAALASAAFPLGLASRQVAMTVQDYTVRNWPIPDGATARMALQPDFPPAWLAAAGKHYHFTATDGGVINNEPFEYVRYCLMATQGVPNERDGDKADRAVVMIAPFPEPPAFLPDGEPGGDLIAIAKALFPALKAHVRFKPGEAAAALKDDVFSRFLIAPIRVPPLPASQVPEPYGIACGLLDGFGGFLDEQLRAHDYQLGRRNCQWFLRRHLTLYKTAGMFATWPQTAKADRRFQGEPRDGRPTCVLIPLLGDAAPEVSYPQWPRLHHKRLDALTEAFEARLERLAAHVIAEQSRGLVMWLALKICYIWKAKDIRKYIRRAVLADLVRRDQIDGWDLSRWQGDRPATDHEIRLVLGALIEPAFDLQTVGGLARATGLDRSKVQVIAAALETQAPGEFALWVAPWREAGSEKLFTHALFRPGYTWRNSLLRPFRKMIGSLSVGRA